MGIGIVILILRLHAKLQMKYICLRTKEEHIRLRTKEENNRMGIGNIILILRLRGQEVMRLTCHRRLKRVCRGHRQKHWHRNILGRIQHRLAILGVCGRQDSD